MNRESSMHAPVSPASEEARRHRRMNEGADELVPERSTTPAGSGATGIDMGSGGGGTDIE